MFYLQDKIIIVMEPISKALDDLDLVIHSLQSATVYRIMAMADKAIAIVIQCLSKLHQGLDIAGYGRAHPGIKTFVSPASGFIIPDPFKIILQHIGNVYVLVQFKQCLELFFLVLLKFAPVLKQ